MILFFSILLLVCSIIPVVALLRIKTITSTLLVIYLVSYGLITIAVEVIGFLGILNNKTSFIVTQLVETIIIWGIWFIRGKPNLNLFGLLCITCINVGDILKCFKRSWLLVIFGIIVITGYGILAWLILNVPPNNSDSMHTHLARVMYWLQQGSFEKLTSHSIYANIYPFNAQLNVLWTILLTGTDKFVGFIQWFAALFTAVAIFGLSRLLDGQKRFSLLISVIWLTFPLVVFEATSTQFDLVVTVLFCIAIYFFFDFYKNGNSSSIVMSSLAMGLALGTKQTVFMFGPGIALITVTILFSRKQAFTWIFKWSLLTTIFFVLMGSFTYINNLRYYDNPLGPSEHVALDSIGNYSFKEKLRYNPLRFLYQFISFDSLPLRIGEKGITLKTDIFKKVDYAIGLNLESEFAVKDIDEGFEYSKPPSFNEDTSWFSLAGFLLFSPAFFIGFYKGIREKNLLALSIVILVFSFFFMEMLLRPGWDPYQGRYFITSFAILCPVSIYLFSNRIVSRIYQLLLIGISVLTFFFAIVSNETKPLLGTRFFEYSFDNMETTYIPENVFGLYYRKYSLKYLSWMHYNLPFLKSLKDYSEVELAAFGDRSHHLSILQKVNDVVPENARMGIMLVNGDFDYVFFGRSLSRTLINIDNDTRLNDDTWMRNNRLDFVLISNVARISSIPEYLEPVAFVNGWGLFMYSK